MRTLRLSQRAARIDRPRLPRSDQVSRFEYRYASIKELASALRSGDATCSEAAESALDLAADVGRRFGAIASLLPSRALSEATRADLVLSGGGGTTLTGIPYGAKDVIAADGGPTTWGVPSMLGRTLHEDATVIKRLKRRGALLVAKCVTTSLAGGGGHRRPGISAHGQPMNPWDPRRFAGSSSSGSAIAVAHGIVPFALGTETGGSVIQPASFCGVTGYRPSFGWIPRGGVMPLSPQLDKVGVIARTAEDCASVATSLWGSHRTDSYSRSPRRRVANKSKLQGIRVGLDPNELTTTTPSMRAALAAAATEFVRLTGNVVETEICPDNAYGDAIELLIRVDAAHQLREYIHDPHLRLADEYQLERLRTADRVPAVSYSYAVSKKHDAESWFKELFRSIDVILTASFPTPPQERSADRSPRGAGSPSERVLAGANLAGLPGLTLPGGLDTNGLPVGMHLVGPQGSDRLLLSLGLQYQMTTDHHLLRPPSR